MAEQVERDELLELTRFVPHLAIAECLPGLSCDVFAGGENMSLAVGADVSRQLAGSELRNNAVISNSTSFEYWILVRVGVRSFRPSKGPLTAGQLRSAFSVIGASASGVDDTDSNISN
jgi:hypothetical protein